VYVSTWVCVCMCIYLQSVFLSSKSKKKILSSHFSPHNFPISRNVNKIASSICSPFYICLFKTFSLSLQIREPQLSYNTYLPSGMCDCKYNANCIPSFLDVLGICVLRKLHLLTFRVRQFHSQGQVNSGYKVKLNEYLF